MSFALKRRCSLIAIMGILLMSISALAKDAFNVAQFEKSLQGKTPEIQVKMFGEALRSFPDHPVLNQMLKDWSEPVFRRPLSHLDQFEAFYKNFTAEMGDASGMRLAGGIENLYAEQASLQSRGQWSDLFYKKRKARVNALIETIESNYNHLLPAEKLFVLHAKEGAKGKERKALFEALYRSAPNDDFDRFAFLNEKKFELKPQINRPFDQALKDVLVERLEATQAGKLKPVGPVLFDRLMIEDPKLAEQHLATFLNAEFFPQTLGGVTDRSIQNSKVGVLASSSASNPAVEHLFQQLLDRPDWKNTVNSIVTQVSPARAEAYRYKEKFVNLVPFVSAEEISGQRFIFRHGAHLNVQAMPEYRKASEKYLLYLAENPKKLTEEIALQGRLYKSLDDLEYLKGFFKDNPKNAYKIMRTFIDESAEIRKLCTPELLNSQTQLAERFRKVLKAYLDSGISTPGESVDAIAKFKSFLVPTRGNEGHRVIFVAMNTEFDSWVQKNHPIFQLIRDGKVESRVVNSFSPMIEKDADLAKTENLKPCDVKHLLKMISPH